MSQLPPGIVARTLDTLKKQPTEPSYSPRNHLHNIQQQNQQAVYGALRSACEQLAADIEDPDHRPEHRRNCEVAYLCVCLSAQACLLLIHIPPPTISAPLSGAHRLACGIGAGADCTLSYFHSGAHPGMVQLREILQTFAGLYGSELPLSAVHPEELGGAWQVLSDLSRQFSIRVPEDELRDLLLPAPYKYDLLQPPLERLCPVTPPASVQPLLDSEPHSTAWLCGIILSYLLSLDQLSMVNVTALYNHLGHLRATRSMSAEHQALTGQLLDQALAVTGPVRVPGLKRGLTLRTNETPLICQQTIKLLRTLVLSERCGGNYSFRVRQNNLWDEFEYIDHWLQVTHPLNDIIILLTALQATISRPRAPGMPLGPETELGAQISGLDPLFGWKDLQDEVDSELLSSVFITRQMAMILRQLIEMQRSCTVRLLTDEDGREFRAILNEGVQELSAQLRDLGIQPPRPELLKMLSDRGELRRITPQWSRRIRNYPYYQELHHVTGPWKQRNAALCSRATTWAETAQQHPLQHGHLLETEQAADPSTDPSTAPSADRPANRTWPQSVLDLRKYLGGGHVLLLGGELLPTHAQAIKEAFGVELEWIPSGRYENGAQAAVRLREDTRLVILAVRWMAHAHTSLRDEARARGIPAVMHPAGLNPVSLAHHTLMQVGRQLERSRQSGDSAEAGAARPAQA